MEQLAVQIKININPKVYLKDPFSSALGLSILRNGIELIDELGFESFTFRKRGQRIGSPESSLYRYFENKHKLLLYSISWYWGWLEYRLVFATATLSTPEARLRKAIEILTEEVQVDSDFSHINEVILNRVVIKEAPKVYYTKEVDIENKEGFFMVYKRLVNRVSDMILAVAPEFHFPHMLVSALIEGSHHQQFFAEHLPSLTDVKGDKNVITRFYTDMVFQMIRK